jgi:6-phosphogluconolactonase/glucosamine-6-phosphate isomerase/deaminase
MDARAGPLKVPKASLGIGSSIPLDLLPDNDAVIRRFADDLLQEYASAKRECRGRVVFIVPVGPVGQYDLWAERCNRERISLRDLVLINMDEYLTSDCRDLIPLADPLSFRRHMTDHFYLNRPWQAAIVRKILHGPVSPAVPASLLQHHRDARLVVAEHVAELPEPRLQ